MSKINLPPFYVGQKVVSLITRSECGASIKKGQICTIKSITQCLCGAWKVDIGLRFSRTFRTILCNRCHIPVDLNTKIVTINADHFAPIEEKFETISYKKVITQEKPLICPN